MEECDRVPSIYVRTAKGKGGASWFLLEGPPARSETLSPVFSETAPIFRKYSGCAAVGSTVYLMGGEDPDGGAYTPDVYWIDTLRPEQGWNKLDSSLNHPRSCARGVVTSDGKLYAMGRCWVSEDFVALLKPEVYTVGDSGGSWRVLKDPPTGLQGAVYVPGRMDGHVVLDLDDDDGGKKTVIVMHSFGESQLYSYDVGADSWDVYHKDFPPWTCASALLDGILYYLDQAHPGVMFGLDLNKPNNEPKRVVLTKNFKEDENHRWIPQPIPQPFWNPPLPPSTTFLVSLGSGKLAALSEDGSNFKYHISVGCSIIKMSKKAACDGQVNFVAYPLSFSSYNLPAACIFDCLVGFPPETRKRTLENATAAAASI